MVQMKGSIQTPEFDMKHLKKTEEHIGRNVGIITIKMGSIVRVFYIIIIIKIDTKYS